MTWMDSLMNDTAGVAVLLCFSMRAVPIPVVLMSCLCPFSPSLQVHWYVNSHHHELYCFFCWILCSRGGLAFSHFPWFLLSHIFPNPPFS